MGEKAVLTCAALLMGAVFALIFGFASWADPDLDLVERIHVILLGFLVGIGIVWGAYGVYLLFNWADNL